MSEQVLMNAQGMYDVPPRVPVLDYLGVCGRGGMSVVYKAHHRTLNREIAVKVLNREFSTSKTDVEQFMTEGRTMSFLSHPGIVQGYGALAVDGRYLFMMDFINGYSVGDFFRRKARLQEIDARIVLQSVAGALNYMWKRFHMVHCDIKPDNLMISIDGDVKIADLGLAREITADNKPVSPDADGVDIEGTPAYMSPEQINGDVLDCRCDIYSLGATLYHLLTGRLLFPNMDTDHVMMAHVSPDCQAPDPRQFVPNLTSGFAVMLANMLVKDRDRRYCSWQDVLVTFNDMENGCTIRRPNSPSSVRLDV